MWNRYNPSSSKPWDAKRATHLFRRAAFGGSAEEIERAVSDGVDATVDRILAGEVTRPDSDSVDVTSTLLAESAIATNQLIKLKSAWILRIMNSADPLREKVTLMWHDHFATSNIKLDSCYAMWQQNQLFRKSGFGSFRELVDLVLHDPAMLQWLDAASNVKEAPNENLAREVMELFTLGVDNYTEGDVKEVARTLTGRTLDDNMRCIDDKSSHDAGEKTIFGKTSSYSANDLPELLTSHPQCSLRVTWRVCRCFLGEDVVTPKAHAALADQYRSNKWSIRKLIETVLRSERFFASLGKRITPPVDFAAAAIRMLRPQDRPSPAILADWLAELGHDLFLPPNVAGWPSGETWLSPQRMISRMRFAAALATGELRSQIEPIRPKLANAKSKVGSIPPHQLLIARPLSDASQAIVQSSPESITTLLSLPEAQID